MIGVDSMTCRPPSAPARTGQQPMFSHACTPALAHSGGSVIEMNAPPCTPMIMCAATSAVGSASSLVRGTAAGALRLSTRTRSRAAPHGPGNGVREHRHGAGQLLPPADDVPLAFLASGYLEFGDVPVAASRARIDRDDDLVLHCLVPGRAVRSSAAAPAGTG